MQGPKPPGFAPGAAAALMLAALLCFCPPFASTSRAKTLSPPNIITDAADPKRKARALALPYAFKSESLDWAYGAAAGSAGYGQEQLGLFGAVLGSSNSSKAVYFYASNLKLPVTERLFLNA